MSRYWGGALVDDRLADQMDEVARLVPGGTVLRPTQGSWSGGVAASGGTHSGGGAIDLAGQDPGMTTAMRNAIRDAMRQVGIAAWVRTPAQSNWPYHVHGISVQPGGQADVGCLSGPAHDQVVDYYQGRNGLASGAPDDGPRTWVGVTWETYQQEEDMSFTDADRASLVDAQQRAAQAYAAANQVMVEFRAWRDGRAKALEENAGEARRLGAVVLAAGPPKGNERTIPQQLDDDQ